MCTLHDKFNLNLAIHSQKKKKVIKYDKKQCDSFRLKKGKKGAFSLFPHFQVGYCTLKMFFFGISCTYLFDLLVLTYLTI